MITHPHPATHLVKNVPMKPGDHWSTRIPAFLRDKNDGLLIRSFASRRPNATTPDVGGDGRSDRDADSVFSIAPRGAELRPNARFGADHLRGGVRNNIGNTIETSRADRRDESNLCAAIPRVVATHSLRNNSVIRAHDPARALHACTSSPEILCGNQSCIFRQRHRARASVSASSLA